MIRHEAEDAFLLITQHDHALLAGELARHFGTRHFEGPQPRQSVLHAVAQHDCGWPIHDDRPTLNERGLPLHVFETPPHIGAEVWTASAERTAAADPTAGLLVSLHVLALSSISMQVHSSAGTDPTAQQRLFLLNRFQHNEVERQHRLRARLGLRTDLPLRQGLARPGADRREDQLIFNLRFLQAMDQLSLALCCSERPLRWIELVPHPGAPAVRIDLSWSGPQHLHLHPWPFEAAQIDLTVPYSRVPRQPYPDKQALRQAISEAPRGALPLLLAAR